MLFLIMACETNEKTIICNVINIINDNNEKYVKNNK
jgi:hypothetical protein